MKSITLSQSYSLAAPALYKTLENAFRVSNKKFRTKSYSGAILLQAKKKMLVTTLRLNDNKKALQSAVMALRLSESKSVTELAAVIINVEDKLAARIKSEWKEIFNKIKAFTKPAKDSSLPQKRGKPRLKNKAKSGARRPARPTGKIKAKRNAKRRGR